MPRHKPKNKTGQKLSKDDALKKKKELEDLIFNDEILEGLGSPDIPPLKSARIMNFDLLKSEVERESKGILTSLVKFYVDSDVLNEKEYINFRAKIDALNISTMAFQIRAAQHAVTKMLDEIDAGTQYQVKNFEVLAQMQNQLMQMPAKFQSYITEMEKTYKNLNTESRNLDNVKQPVVTDDKGNPVIIPGISGEGGTVRVRGSKTLMEGLQNVIKTEIIVKEAHIVDSNKNLIDPKTKDLITPENELKIKMEDETKSELDEDLF